LTSGALHPMTAKRRLAFQLVLQSHGEAAARGAQDEFDRVFRQGELPDEMPNVMISQDDLVDGKIAVFRLIVIAGLASSNSEARRLIKQGGVRVDDVTVDDVTEEIEPRAGMVVNVGKRRFAKIITE
jgi:tyrosyl-tRNA synthetase